MMRLPEPLVPKHRPPGGRDELDESLLRRAQAGETAALELFVSTYERRIFAYLSRSLGRATDVEDFAQETFLRAIVALPRFVAQPPALLSTWLFCIARRLVLDSRKRKFWPLVQLPVDVPSDGRNPEEEADQREKEQSLENAVRKLPLEFQEAFILAEFHELSHEEIAYITGAKAGTVKTRLYRARELLRGFVSAEGRGHRDE